MKSIYSYWHVYFPFSGSCWLVSNNKSSKNRRTSVFKPNLHDAHYFNEKKNLMLIQKINNKSKTEEERILSWIKNNIYFPKIYDTRQNQKLLIKIQNVSLSNIVQISEVKNPMQWKIILTNDIDKFIQSHFLSPSEEKI